MNNQSSIEKLITSGKRVYTTDDLAVVWQISNRKRLIERIKYYLRQNRLTHIHKGVYAYGEYGPLEVAQKLVPLSYLSLYTTAQMHGLTFQYYSTIFSIALVSKKYTVGGQMFAYHRIKEQVFYNALGLEHNGSNTFAGKERTICDLLYTYPGFAFDNLRGVDADLLQTLAPMYGNKRLEREITSLLTQLGKG